MIAKVEQFVEDHAYCFPWREVSKGFVKDCVGERDLKRMIKFPEVMSWFVTFDALTKGGKWVTLHFYCGDSIKGSRFAQKHTAVLREKEVIKRRCFEKLKEFTVSHFGKRVGLPHHRGYFHLVDIAICSDQRIIEHEKQTKRRLDHGQ